MPVLPYVQYTHNALEITLLEPVLFNNKTLLGHFLVSLGTTALPGTLLSGKRDGHGLDPKSEPSASCGAGCSWQLLALSQAIHPGRS